MAYIGKTPVIGNFQVCDAISVVNGQAAYTMQVGGVNVSPESANHMLVSLNGILQAPTSSFTVSGSTITFASNLVTGDVIDFIQILGNVLDLGVPSDSTVSLAKLTATGTKDATTFLRGDNTFATVSSDFVKIQSTTVSSNVSSVTLTGFDDSVYASYLVRVNNAITELTGTQRGNIKMRVNTSGGVQSGGSDYQYISGYVYRRFDDNSTPSSLFSSEGDNKIVLNGWSLSANDAQNTEITFANPQSTSHAKIFNCSTTYWKTSSDSSDGPYIVEPQNVNGIYTQTTALTGLTFLPEANSATAIAGGNFCLYGLKK